MTYTPQISNASAFISSVAATGSGVLGAQSTSVGGDSLEDVASAIRYTVVLNAGGKTIPWANQVPNHARITDANPDMLIRSARVGDAVGVSYVGGEPQFFIAESLATVIECPSGA